jgi:hypothetical protein
LARFTLKATPPPAGGSDAPTFSQLATTSIVSTIA